MANTSVIGIYSTYDDLATAVDALRIAGFRNTDISALLPANQGTKDLITSGSSSATRIVSPPRLPITLRSASSVVAGVA